MPAEDVARVHGAACRVLGVQGDTVTLVGRVLPRYLVAGLLVRWLGYCWRVARVQPDGRATLEAWGPNYLASPKLTLYNT